MAIIARYLNKSFGSNNTGFHEKFILNDYIHKDADSCKKF